MHGAGAALSDAAAVSGPRQTERVPQYPEQRGVGIHIDLLGMAVDGEMGHSVFLGRVPGQRGSGCVGKDYRQSGVAAAFPLWGTVVHHEDALAKFGWIAQNLGLA